MIVRPPCAVAVRAPSVLLGFEIGGIVGYKLLGEYRTAIDLQRSELRLSRAVECITERTGSGDLCQRVLWLELVGSAARFVDCARLRQSAGKTSE